MMKGYGYAVFMWLCFFGFGSGLVAQTTEDYQWKSVPIGGGGYITGMKIHPLDASKRYYRTDVGGAYRWDAGTGRMEQMVFSTNKNHYSVAGIALHPSNTNLVYLAVGRNCALADQAILESTDAGVTFNPIPETQGVFWFAANGGRDCETQNDMNGANKGDKDRQGTPLAINPLNTNELYIGTRERGLYILNLNTKVLKQIPAAQIPHNSDQYSIRSVVFHPSLPYVYIAYPGFGVYRGDTNTDIYTNLDYPALPDYSQLLDAIDISLSKDADYMLVACKKQGIMKATNLGGTVSWVPLTGLNAAQGEGYLTADCSPHDNDVAISVVADWNHINEFQVTTDGGASWTQIDGSIGTNLFGWRNSGFASHVSQIAFDPGDATKMHYTSWFSTYMSEDFTLAGPNVWHNLNSKGHEEIVPTDIVSFPVNTEGNFMMTGSGDHTGFIFDQVIEQPDSFANCQLGDKATQSLVPFKKSSSMDFCESNPNYLIVSLTREWSNSGGALLKSSNGGKTWSLAPGYDSSHQKPVVTLSSQDHDNIVVLTKDGLQYSKDGGATAFQFAAGSNTLSPDCVVPFTVTCLASTQVTGSWNGSVFGAYRNITSDRSLGCVFYHYDWNGDFSISTDGGENWCVINQADLPASSSAWNKTRLVSIPGHPGHLWLNVNNELFHTDNGGADWTNFSTNTLLDKAKALTFGKGFGPTYPALYIFGRLDGQTTDYLYRSDDMAANWIRINDHAAQQRWGDIKILAGDRNVAGRLYGTASGQGVIFGDSEQVTTCDASEKTIDGEFDDVNMPSIPNWTVNQINGATMSGSINPWTKAVLDIDNAGTFDWDLQLWQDDLAMEANRWHLIRVDLRADSDRTVTLKLRNKPNGSLVYLEKEIEVTSVAQEYAFLLYSTVADPDLRLTLMVGGDATTLYVDHIRFREFCAADVASLDCLEFLSVQGEAMSGQYQISKVITSEGVTNTGDQVIYRAGEAILLSPGFEVLPGGVFVAEIQDCN